MLIKPANNFLLFTFLFLASLNSQAQSIMYVTTNGAGNTSGSSWQDALKGDDLRNAIWTAPTNTTFWIAAGTYKPHTTSKDSAFYIFNKSIKLYGGFSGTETEVSERDYLNNPTILSGAVHPTDSAGYSDVIIRYQNGDSSVLDGFVIQDAHGRTALLNESSMYETQQSRVFIRNTTFRKNKSIYNSQAAAFVNPLAGHAMLHFFNCDFTENYNGAIGIRQGLEYFRNRSTIVADSCRFYNNAGNVVVLYGISRVNNSASIQLNRCEFRENYEVSTGAIIMFAPAIYLGQVVPEGVVSLELDSCYFGNNNVANTIYYFPNMADSSRFLMNNCVIDSNGYSNPSLPYGHGNTAVIMSSRTRTNKNYVLNSRINHSSSYYHPAQSTTVAVSAERPGTDSTFIYNVLFNNCQNMNTNIAHQAFNGRKSAVYLVNSTLFKNEISTQRGWRMILNEGINTTGTGAVTHFYIQNSIIWPSTKHWWPISVPKQLINNSESYASPGTTKMFIQNSIINAFADGGSISNIGDDRGGNILQEPIFKDSLSGNFALVCSTGINQGSNALYNTSLGGLVDLNQRDRFNGTIDIGAFEHYPDSVVVSINGPTTVCSGQQATFTAAAENDGVAPIFEWFVNGAASGQGTSFSSASLANNDVISVIVTSSIRCIEKSKDTSSVQIVIVPPAATPTLQVTQTEMPVCAGNEIVFTASANIQQAAYQWMVNGSISGTNSNVFSSSTLQQGDKVSVSVSGNHITCTGLAPVQLYGDTITISQVTPIVPSLQITASPGGNTLPFTISVANPIPGWIYTLYRNNINTMLTGISFSNLQDTGMYEVRGAGGGCYTSNTAVSNSIVKNAEQTPGVFTTIVLHPVPVSQVLTVSGISTSMAIKHCNIYDAKGSLVYTRNIEGLSNFEIGEFSRFAAGVYIVVFVQNTRQIKSYKVIKL